MLEGLRGYLQLASGLTELSRRRAMETARTVIAQGGASVEQMVPEQVRQQVTSMADELMATSRANRTLLVGLIRSEVERNVAALGLVSAAEVEEATRRADRLEARVRELEILLGERAGSASTDPRRTASGRAAPPRGAKTGVERKRAAPAKGSAAAAKRAAPRARPGRSGTTTPNPKDPS
jgi:polyhydroxyalkanoate synthesis regulator phasin